MSTPQRLGERVIGGQELQTLQRSVERAFGDFQDKQPGPGVQIDDIDVDTTAVSVNHKLGRKWVGWMVVRSDAAVSVFNSAAPDETTLELTASGPATISVWVY